MTMSQIDVSMSLAEMVDAYPGLAREFERRHLDYCCDGAQTLADACSRAGLDVDGVIEELSAVCRPAVPASWSTMTADALVDHLVFTHHRYLWEELPRITALVEKVLHVHGARHPELTDIAACYTTIRADLEPHLLKEERVLFPMIRELARTDVSVEFHCGTLRNPIGVMLREHDDVGALLARLRTLTDGHTAPADGCATYQACFAAFAELEADTHLHIHKENNVLFPLVVRLESAR